MRTYHITFLSLFLILFLSHCSTTNVVQSVTEAGVSVSDEKGELRGFGLLPEAWKNEGQDIMKKNIVAAAGKAAAANYNALFFLTNSDGVITMGDYDPLISAIEAAHNNKLKIFAGIDIAAIYRMEKDKPLPQIITTMKGITRNLAVNYDIDGLCLVHNDNPADFIEDMVVEAMLVKPYLINIIVYSGEAGYNEARSLLDKGVADLIIPGPESGIAGKAALIQNYPARAEIPDDLKKIRPEQVIGLDLSGLFPGESGGRTVIINKGFRTKITDSEGYIGFIQAGQDTIILEADGKTIILPEDNWSVPFRYVVTADNKVERRSPWVEFRNRPGRYTDLTEFDFLCKTEYPASVSIGGIALKQYKTGIFFSKVQLEEGANRVRASVLTSDSTEAFYEDEYIFRKRDLTRKAFPLWISGQTVDPAYDLELLPADMVRISFQGSLKQEAYIEVLPGKKRVVCSREDFGDYSLYRGDLPMEFLKKGKQNRVILKLIPAEGTGDSRALEYTLKNQVTVKDEHEFPYIKITAKNSRLTYNLGAPRLGGPVRAELGPGVILKTNGKFGRNYRVRLSSTENGFISQDEAELLPEATVRPSYYITSMSCGPGKDADILTIPYPEPVPYEAYPDPDHKRIVITLFGVETSSTWITHLDGRRVIDKITWEQVTPETYKVYVNLKSEQIWGYSLKQEGKRLLLRLRYPPEYNLENEMPFSGIKIAIEAGHGGSGMGAIGLSGLVEKDINLDLSLRLGELLRSKGAEIVQVRDSDKDMGLIEKRDIAESSEADLFVSIHANAGGGGYLRVAGTSTYYNNPFWAPMAEMIYSRLLELGLKEFGVIGSFNYTPVRLSYMPSILVEQAFMSNAEDEEKLADPEFRGKMADKICEGISDYLKFMKR